MDDNTKNHSRVKHDASRTSRDHQYDQHDFLYSRKGPWPQPSPVHPWGESPAVIHVPLRERLDWWFWIGSRYLIYLLLTPYYAVKALMLRGLKPVSDSEFEQFFNQSMLVKFITSQLDDVDRDVFNGILQQEQQNWHIVDFQAVESVKPFKGIHVSATKTLLYQQGDRFKVRAIYIDATASVISPDDSGWALAKYFVLQGGALCSTLVTHPLQHFPFDSINAITKTALPKTHVLHQLLTPHMRFTLPLENAVLNYKSSLLQSKWYMVYAPYPGGPSGLRDLLVDGYKGIKGNLSYPPFSYQMDAPNVEGPYGIYLTRYYEVIFAFVKRVLHHVEPDDFWVAKWADYCHQHVKAFPASDKIFEGDTLARAVATYIFTVSVSHSVDHYSYGKFNKRQIPLRIRQSPPTASTSMKPRSQLVTWYDMMKYFMADRLFFSPTTITTLAESQYAFMDSEQQQAVEEFKTALLIAENELIERGVNYMPLDEIAASIQF
ncbi:hypothetical protein [Shewanella waksmanii]|uniref:hypothetical protein n=1 Tax=Shewanella waksmanii TaxID=213783 RepID=UPI0037358CF6